MNMSERAGHMMKEWAIFFGALALLHVLLFAGWIMLEALISQTPLVAIVFMVVYLVLFAAIIISFVRRVNNAAAPLKYREAREHGLSATAKVLEIKPTHWRDNAKRTFGLQKRPTKREYQMRLRVKREGEAAYEASMAEFLTGDQVPYQGTTIPIKVHPQHPDVIVMNHETPT